MKPAKMKDFYKRILIFSDDLNTFHYLLSCLTKKQCQVIVVPMNSKAIEVIEETQPAMIVLDHDALIAKMDGSEFLEGVLKLLTLRRLHCSLSGECRSG
jgi:DNA-binding response OmpR family regulator